MKRAKLKGMAEGPLKQLTQALEKVKAQIRARVEHPFHVVKNCSTTRRLATGAWLKTVRSTIPCLRWAIW